MPQPWSLPRSAANALVIHAGMSAEDSLWNSAGPRAASIVATVSEVTLSLPRYQRAESAAPAASPANLQPPAVRGVNHPDGDVGDPDGAARCAGMEHGRGRHLAAELEPARGFRAVDLDRLAIVPRDGLDHLEDVREDGAHEAACPGADENVDRFQETDVARLANGIDAPAGFIRRDHGTVPHLLAQGRVGRRGLPAAGAARSARARAAIRPITPHRDRSVVVGNQVEMSSGVSRSICFRKRSHSTWVCCCSVPTSRASERVLQRCRPGGALPASSTTRRTVASGIDGLRPGKTRRFPDAASARAMALGSYHYRTVKNILTAGQDRLPLEP